MNNFLKALIVTLCFVLSTNVLGCNLPAELQEWADILGCENKSDFFERPGPVETGYIYGVLPGRKYSSAAFWCLDKKNNEAKLIVLKRKFTIDEFKIDKSCSGIVKQKWKPGGFQILSDFDHYELFFEYPLFEKSYLSSAHTDDLVVLQSSYDGEGYLYFCDNSKWYFMPIE